LLGYGNLQDGKEHKLPTNYSVGPSDAVTLIEEPGGDLSAKVDGQVIARGRAAAA